MIIKRFGVGSVAKMYGALMGGMGLIFGAIIALASLAGMGLAEGDEPQFMAAAFGIGAVVILPIFYGVMGVVIGAISAALYNLVARVAGGIRIETE